MAFPIGIASISAALQEAGHAVRAINLTLCQDAIAETLAGLDQFAPDLVGIGGLTSSFSQIRQVHDAIRDHFPGLATMLGGGILTSAVDTIFQAIEPDFGIIGEGEITAVELARALEEGRDPGQIPGLIYRAADGVLTRTPARPVIKDLDTLPMPDYEGFGFRELKARGGYLEILGSRGCPYACTFCYSPLGRRYRQRSLDHLFKEIEQVVHTYELRFVGISDELFAASPQRVREFCTRISSLGIHWHTQLRVDSVDEETLRLMREAGCVLISYGLESMDADVLLSMHKKVTPAKIADTLETTYKVGLNIFGNFIFGDPAETKQSAANTLAWWFDHRAYLISLYMITAWPGSKIYNDALQKGIIADELQFIAQGCPLINLTSMSDEEYWQLVDTIDFYREVLLYPAKVLDPAQVAPGVWRLQTICPHCGVETVFEAITAAYVLYYRTTVRLGCQCRRTYDLPILVPVPEVPDYIQNKAAFLRVRLHRGDRTALEALDALSLSHPRFPGPGFLAAQAHLSLGDLERACQSAKRSLRADPCVPQTLRLMSAVMAARGETKPAEVFEAQAKWMEDCQPEGWVSPLMAPFLEA